MKTIISFLITTLLLISCCEQPSNSYGTPQTTFKKETNNMFEEYNKALEEYKNISQMGKFRLYDVLPDSTKIYQNINLYIVVSPTGYVAIEHR